MRNKMDFKLKLRKIPVRFLDDKEDDAIAEGNNAAWNCTCGKLLLGRSYYQFGDTCYTECECGKLYRVNPDAKKKAHNVTEISKPPDV